MKYPEREREKAKQTRKKHRDHISSPQCLLIWSKIVVFILGFQQSSQLHKWIRIISATTVVSITSLLFVQITLSPLNAISTEWISILCWSGQSCTNRNVTEVRKRRFRAVQRTIFVYLSTYSGQPSIQISVVECKQPRSIVDGCIVIYNCSQKLFGVINVHQRATTTTIIHYNLIYFANESKIQRSASTHINSKTLLPNTRINQRTNWMLYAVCTAPIVKLPIPIENHKWQKIAYLTRLTFQCLPPVSKVYGKKCASPQCVHKVLIEREPCIVWHNTFVRMSTLLFQWPAIYRNFLWLLTVFLFNFVYLAGKTTTTTTNEISTIVGLIDW